MAKKKETKRTTKSKQKTMNKMALSTYLSIMILNVNGLNAPIKRHRVTEWIQKPRPINMIPTRDSL